jgi:transcriptional regulator with XRE-family HTH domain
VSALSEGGSDGVSQRVGQRIRQARQEHGMSLAQLGGTELSRGFLSLVESGRSSISPGSSYRGGTAHVADQLFC